MAGSPRGDGRSTPAVRAVHAVLGIGWVVVATGLTVLGGVVLAVLAALVARSG